MNMNIRVSLYVGIMVASLVVLLSSLNFTLQDQMLVNSVAPYVRGTMYDSMTNYAIREMEKTTAENAAKLGHQTVLNREAARNLQYGDVVKFADEVLIVKHKDKYEVNLHRMPNLGLRHITLYLGSLRQFTPDKFREVWKRGTPEWQRVVNEMILGKMWVDSFAYDNPTMLTP